MQLVAGTFFYDYPNPLFLRSFRNFLARTFFYENVAEIDELNFELEFQNSNYEIELQFFEKINCVAILMKSDNEFEIKPRYKGFEYHVIIGLPVILSNYLQCVFNKDYIECKMYEPEIFTKILSAIERRAINHSMVRKLYSGRIDLSMDFKKCKFSTQIQEMQIAYKEEKTSQPWTVRILESKDNKSSIAEFFLKTGLEFGFDNQIYLETLFMPIEFEEMKNFLKIDETKNHIKKISGFFKKNKSVTLIIQERDNWAFIIDTDKNYIYLEEFFWWS